MLFKKFNEINKNQLLFGLVGITLVMAFAVYISSNVSSKVDSYFERHTELSISDQIDSIYVNQRNEHNLIRGIIKLEDFYISSGAPVEFSLSNQDSSYRFLYEIPFPYHLCKQNGEEFANVFSNSKQYRIILNHDTNL